MQKPRYKIFSSLLFTATILAGLCAGNAKAEEFRFVREGDPDRIFKQSQELIVELPSNLSGAEMNSLFLELDGTDITQLVTLEGTRVVFYPASPYTAGKHTLRLVKMGKNNKLVEINRWRFTTSSEPPKESPSAVSGSVDATYSVLPWENTTPSRNIPRNNLSSQAQIQGTTQTEGWQLSGRGNGFINTEDSFNPDGKHIEIGEYLLSAERPDEAVSIHLQLGNHDMGVDNLLMDNFYRRGASASFDINQNLATVTGFSQDPAAAIGNANISGVGKANQRASGIHTTLRPIAALDERLELEATAYQGKGSVYGAGSRGVDLPVNKADGYQLGANSVLLKDYLTLRTQYAHSNFDFDGANSGNPSERDAAQRVSFVLTPLGSLVSEDGRLQRWTVEASYQKVGTFFDTLLNSGLEKDRTIYALGSNYLLGGLNVDGEVSLRTDNVSDIEGLPTDRSIGTWVQASYAPEEEWFGTPVFFAGASLNDEAREKTPTGYEGPNLDRITSSLNGGLSMSYENTLWSLSHTITTLSDDVNGSYNYTTHYTDLTVEFRPLEIVTLRPGLQMEYLDEAADGTSRSYHARLGADVMIIQDKVWNTSNYSMLLNSGQTSNVDDYSFQTEFTWQLEQAEINSPGYALALAGIYDNVPDPITGRNTNQKDARALLQLKINAPFAF